MAYSLPFNPSGKILELGGGTQPMFHPNVDIREGPGIDIVADLSKPLPVDSDSYDGIFSKYALEHVSWRVMPALVKEAYRIVKPNGKAVFVIPNTKAQMEWALKQEDETYDKVAQCLFGDLDYAENSHKSAFSPAYAIKVFREAGFSDVAVVPHGELKTDMIVESRKAMDSTMMSALSDNPAPEKTPKDAPMVSAIPAPPKETPAAANWSPEERKQAYDRRYFDGATGPVGGYSREGYRDFPAHWTTFNKIMEKKPESVLEIGCARGYILKRLEDVGVRVAGLEISEHCYHTRVVEPVTVWDVTQTPWPFKDKEFDLCYNVAVLEHIPESLIDKVIAEIKRVSKRGLHGVDFGDHDDGFDKTHCFFATKEAWEKKFGDPAQEIVDKEDLEKGPISLPAPDGKIKLNVGSFTTMFHYGWMNFDIHPLHDFAKGNGFLYQQHDVRHGIPYAGGSVEMIYACHFLEHLTYDEGVAFLKECHRTLRVGGTIRLILPDAGKLIRMYTEKELKVYDELNEGAAKSPTDAGKLWNLLFSGHSAMYDAETLLDVMKRAGFTNASSKNFRQSDNPQMLRETFDLLPTISLYAEAVR
jgi:predicted SAM-dependent methyltransferase